MTRRLRVRMLNANCIGSWSTYWPMFSNHSRLAWAARWVDSTTGRRSASYAASAAVDVGGCSCRQAASASASSIASLVPEPIEKCAVCAASPSSTTLPCRQVSLRTVCEADPARVVGQHLVAVEDVGEELADPRDRRLVGLARAASRAARAPAEPGALATRPRASRR